MDDRPLFGTPCPSIHINRKIASASFRFLIITFYK